MKTIETWDLKGGTLKFQLIGDELQITDGQKTMRIPPGAALELQLQNILPRTISQDSRGDFDKSRPFKSPIDGRLVMEVIPIKTGVVTTHAVSFHWINPENGVELHAPLGRRLSNARGGAIEL